MLRRALLIACLATPALAQEDDRGFLTAFLEDKDVFEAQQRVIDNDRSESQVDINADAGGIQARRILSRLYDEEQAACQAAE